MKTDETIHTQADRDLLRMIETTETIAAIRPSHETKIEVPIRLLRVSHHLPGLRIPEVATMTVLLLAVLHAPPTSMLKHRHQLVQATPSEHLPVPVVEVLVDATTILHHPATLPRHPPPFVVAPL